VAIACLCVNRLLQKCVPARVGGGGEMGFIINFQSPSPAPRRPSSEIPLCLGHRTSDPQSPREDSPSGAGFSPGADGGGR
jgi:hypothetical protein